MGKTVRFYALSQGTNLRGGSGPPGKPALIASRMRTAKPGAPAAEDGPVQRWRRILSSIVGAPKRNGKKRARIRSASSAKANSAGL